ncbi:MAG: hypothetical protein AAFX87_22170 [Bacteroidota bacterium]
MKTAHLIAIFCFSTSLVFGQTIIEEEVICEGFFEMGWESSAFYEKTWDNKVLAAVWLNFDDSFQWTDSLTNLFNKGGFIKVEGIKRTGGNFGHLGGSDSELVVTRLISIDTTMTIEKFFEEK